jgi:phosphotransferase system HPr (HPr) family protein
MPVAEATVVVSNALGLHLRPSEIVSKTALSFRANVTIARGAEVANARSIVDLAALGASLGTRLTIRAEGADAEAAVAAISAVIERKFGED